MPIRKLAAWLVHLYTATGGIIGMFALFAAAERRTEDAFLLLFLSMLVDATDGLLARAVRVREVLPFFDGAMVDNVVDILTFVWIPIFIMWSESLLPAPGWIAVPVLAALYAYGQTEMKTSDAFFLGFPSYWNIVALYLFWLRPEPLFAVLAVVIPAILTLIPTRYIYASKNEILWKTTWTLGGIWLAMVVYMLTRDEPPQTLIWLSFFYPIYYMSASFIIDWRVRHGMLPTRKKAAARHPSPPVTDRTGPIVGQENQEPSV